MESRAEGQKEKNKKRKEDQGTERETKVQGKG